MFPMMPKMSRFCNSSDLDLGTVAQKDLSCDSGDINGPIPKGWEEDLFLLWTTENSTTFQCSDYTNLFLNEHFREIYLFLI